jgi:hypothetical protein
MRIKSLAGWMLLAAGVLAFAFEPATNPASAQPGKGKDGPKEKYKGKDWPDAKAGGPGAHHLRHAYDTLTDVGMVLRADDRAPRELTRLLDQAKDYYRQAHRAYRDGQRFRSGELALAANDAGRG